MKNPSTLQALLTQSFEAERSLRNFSAVASQELITLLASVIGDLNTSPSVDSAKKSLERAIFLSRNLRYFSSGSRADFALTDLSQLIFDCVHSCEPEFKKRNIALEVKVEAPVFSQVDALAFEQTILNLLDFAISHSESGNRVSFTLQLMDQNLQVILKLEKAWQNDTSDNTPLEPCTLESLETQNLALLGLYACSTIVESHSGTFHCLKRKTEETRLVLQLPFDSGLNKPHLLREKRRFQRVKVDFPLVVTLKDGKNFKGRLNVLSTGGGFAALSHAQVESLNYDDQVSLEIQLDADHTLSIPLARVANTHPKGENSGVGLEFLKVDAKAKNLLTALVKAHAS
ncbi:MAG: PilZ domain-containing protein [Pseudomonadota bacterium]